ncbi:SpoIIE family protein phosphatase [Streptomyces goshikiensis]
MATLLVNASRGARRAGETLAEQARQALLDHGRQSTATGQLLRIALDGSSAQLVNAGHPWPLLLRDGAVTETRLAVTRPSAAPHSRTRTRCRTSACGLGIGSCSIPTACRNATPKRSTSPRSCPKPPPSTRGKSCGAPWSARSATPTTAARPRTTPPSSASTGTAPTTRAKAPRRAPGHEGRHD